MTNQYIAGFVDGEAYLGIRKHHSKAYKREFYYQIVVKITQKRSANRILYLFQKKYNGDVYHRIHNIGNANESTMWEISGIKRVTPFIRDIKKYVIVKKPQLKVLEKYIALGNMNRKFSDKEKNKKILDERDKLYKKIRLLNLRGLAETK